MTTHEIPRDQWKTFFDDFSQQHRNWQTHVEVMGLDLGDQVQADNVSLQGISFEPVGSEKGDIEVALGDQPNTFQLHRIEKPTHVRVADTQPGMETDIQIESAEGWTTLVRVKPFEELPGEGRRRK